MEDRSDLFQRADNFNIPYFIVEEELIKEDNNVNLGNKDEKYYSTALRHWIVHLLKAHNAETTVFNYEEVLRSFLEKDNLPVHIACPLTPATSFHCLPTECKLWILHTLRNSNKVPRSPRTVTKDPLNNSYYIVPDCRLYVRLGRTDNYVFRIDEARRKDQPWESLYRFVHSQPWKLLSENQDEWEEVRGAFLAFKLNNLYYAIHPHILTGLSGQSVVKIMNEDRRREFNELLSKLSPIPRARNVEKQKKRNIAVENAAVDALQRELEGHGLNEATNAAAPRQTKPKPNKRVEKCWQFPQCPLANRCPYVHPRQPCTKFPNCIRGWKCLFLHDFCPNDEFCDEPNCAYEHCMSKTTYYRMNRETEENARPVASVTPMVHQATNNGAKTTQESAAAPPTTRPANNAAEKKRRCQFFPQCKKGNDCAYFHPNQPCWNLPQGKKCPGQWCIFMHGACQKDGDCTDMACIYEHYKSPPIVVRKQATNKNPRPLSRAPSMTNLNRINSMSNVSLNSARSTGRRKSVCFEDESDDDLKKKDSKTGILRPPKVQPLCRWGRDCKNKSTCEYEHPSKKCPVFPKCPNGGACVFVHDKCENDGVCGREDCEYEHDLPHEISRKWCKKGSRCNRKDCWFIHPKECIGRCPTPGDCWMYHKPASTSVPRPGPGFPPGPGYSTVPPQQFGPPHGVRYGFGPDFTYRPAPVPPPMGTFPHGYAPGPGMGPGRYGPNPGFAPSQYGNVPGNVPAPGQRPGPNQPPRPTTPGFTPAPPPYASRDMRENDREEHEKLKQLEETKDKQQEEREKKRETERIEARRAATTMTDAQRNLLSELFKTCIFDQIEDYDRMVKVCLTAANLEDAIEMMIQE